MRESHIEIGDVQESGDETATVAVNFDGDAAKLHAVNTAAGWFVVQGLGVDTSMRGTTPKQVAEDASVATIDDDSDVLESAREVSNDGFRSIVAVRGGGEQFSVIVLRTADGKWMPAAFVGYDVS